MEIAFACLLAAVLAWMTWREGRILKTVKGIRDRLKEKLEDKAK